MDIKKITAGEITTDFIEAQTNDWAAAVEPVKEATAVYLADIENRKRSTQEQAALYSADMAELKTERTKLAAKILDLSSRGKIDDAADAEIQLEELDKKISLLERKLKICNSADLKGDPKLYAAAKAAHDAMEVHRDPYKQRIDQLSHIAKEEIARLEKIVNELSYKRYADPGRIANSEWEKVNRHFHELDRAEKEAAEQMAAERKAAKETAGHTRYTYTG